MGDERLARQTQVALTQAKNALLAWSVSRNSDSGTGVAESPAELPCPSPYAPGTPQEGQAAPNNCSHGAIGLLPWLIRNALICLRPRLDGRDG